MRARPLGAHPESAGSGPGPVAEALNASATAGTVKVNRVPSPCPPLSARIRPPVRLHYSFADGQAQAFPSYTPAQVLAVDPGVLPEEVGQALCGYASPLVRDGDGDVHVLHRCAHSDGGLIGRILGRVGEKVGQDLRQALSIRPDPGQVRREVDLDAVPRAAAQERLSCLVHQGRQIRGYGCDRQRARLDPRHVEKVADQAPHVIGLLVDDPEELEHLGGIDGRRGAQHGGRGAFDSGKRRPQLVAHHAQELGPQPLQLFQRRRACSSSRPQWTAPS